MGKRNRYPKKKISLYLSLLVLLFFLIQQCTTSRFPGKSKEEAIDFEKNFFPARIKKEEIIKHLSLTISYNEKHEQANWVAYKISSNHLEGQFKRSDNFKSDPFVRTGSSHPEDFKKSGYDRGHLAPAADFKWSEKAMSESFYMSNMSPQLPAFNRGIWKKLEEKVRDWVKENKELIVVTSGVLTDDLNSIGNVNRISVPEYFYKVILDFKEPEMKGIAFVIENKGFDKNLEYFAVSIDSVERLTGINFFPLLEDELEEILESRVELEKWFK